MRSLAYLVGILILFSGCHSKKITSIEEYHRYISNPENGLVKVIESNELILKMQLLPHDYLYYKNEDSLYLKNNNSLYFLLTIEPTGKPEDQVDITYYGLTSPSEYTQRQFDLNFGLKDSFELHLGEDERILPNLYHWENTYGLTKSKAIQLAFGHDNIIDASEEIKVEFSDPLFDTGITSFVFKKNSLNTLPIVNIL